jgi:hypothetical protein
MQAYRAVSVERDRVDIVAHEIRGRDFSSKVDKLGCTAVENGLRFLDDYPTRPRAPNRSAIEVGSFVALPDHGGNLIADSSNPENGASGWSTSASNGARVERTGEKCH